MLGTGCMGGQFAQLLRQPASEVSADGWHNLGQTEAVFFWIVTSSGA